MTEVRRLSPLVTILALAGGLSLASAVLLACLAIAPIKSEPLPVSPAAELAKHEATDLFIPRYGLALF